MELRLIIMALICLCIAQLAFAAEDTYPFDTKVKEQRFVRLIKELRCAECQNQTLFDSNSGLAQDMRAQIYSMINSGYADVNIRSYLSSRYGEYIFFKPPWQLGTYLLWLGPILMLVVGLAMSIKLLGTPGPRVLGNVS
jgi:cytochrome c-type biogenesis protein CcmH